MIISRQQNEKISEAGKCVKYEKIDNDKKNKVIIFKRDF